MQTDADISLKSAQEGVNEAVKHLSQIVIVQCAGYDEFETTYRETIKGCLTALINIRDALNRD